jgi:phosphatidylinositol alpha-1,6-mannosyltransferase
VLEPVVIPGVVILTPDFPPRPGGIQTLLHRIASSLERYRPVVVTLGHGGAEEKSFDRSQAFPIDRVRVRSGLHRAAIAALNARGLAEAMRRRPAAVLSGHIITGPAALAARRVLRVPIVQYVHAHELGLRPVLARRVLTRVDATIAVSAHARSLVAGMGVPPERVHLVWPGVDTPKGHPARAERQPAVVVVSRLEERYKGHDVLIRSLPLIRSRVPDAKLHVVGDGPLRRHLESLAAGLGVAGAVSFHGQVSDEERDRIMQRATVFAMLSRIDALGSGEGFGIAFLEAGRLGLPVVAGRAAGAQEAVVDGETGILVEPEDHVAVAEVIASLLVDPELAVRLGAAGRVRAEARAWSRVAGEVEDVLDGVVAR